MMIDNTKTTKARIRGVAATAAVLVAGVLLVGCQGSEAEEVAVDSWADDLRVAYEQSESEFERSILRDGVITEAEALEIQVRLQECLDSQFAGSGVEASAVAGVVRLVIAPPETMDFREANLLADYCGERWGQRAFAMFYQMLDNPENLTWEALIIDCLDRSGVHSPGITESDVEDVLVGGCPFPMTLAEAQASPCWSGAWESSPEDEHPFGVGHPDCVGVCRTNATSLITVAVNEGHPRVYVLPGGLRVGLNDVGLNDEEQLARDCVWSPTLVP